MFKNEIRCNMYSYLCNNRKYISLKQLFFALKLNKEDTKIFYKIISEGLTDNILEKNDKDKIKVKDNIGYGYIQIAKNKDIFAFLNQEKYLLKNNLIENVFHGDQVLLEITDKYKLEGRFISVLKHKNSKIRGTIMDSGSFAFLIPDDNIKYPHDIFISKNDSEIGVEQYDRVIVQINEFDINGRPRGKVLYKLSNSDIVEDPLQMIIEKYQIEKDFTNEVKKKASTMKKSISQTNHYRKIDLTDELIFTIDGINSKDLDDAISVKKFGDNYELGVYIADVTNFVEEGSILDKTAFNRGTSYYFVDKVIPMLPVELSNGVCSLNPNEKKMCLGIKMIINPKGELLDREFFECIISSKKKFSYEEINAFLDGKNESFPYENKLLMESIEYALELSSILNKKRTNRNAMMFDFDTMDFEIDLDGGVTRVFPYERGPANKMIEEFMIMANETVAGLFMELKFPYIYRVHDEPFEEKLNVFFNICKAYGLDVPENPSIKDLNKILTKVTDPKLKKGLSMNLITTMKQAKYSEENIGHFGLASNAYCHFTSPIRRYPDLYNHRLLKRYIRRTLNNDVLKEYTEKSINKVASHCCYTERNAAKAEDEYDKLKSLEYFIENSSIEYEALIYSISSRGLYILIDNCITGFIRCKNISYNENTFAGNVNEKTYKIGDTVKVFFSEFDAKDKRLLFALIGGDTSEN